MRNFDRKRVVAGIGAIVTAMVVVLFIPTVIGGWAPILHWTCSTVGSSTKETEWIPAVLVNSPYGGYVTGNATIPREYIAGGLGFGSSDGLPASNGTVGGLFLHLNLTVSPTSNDTQWGPGASVRCASPDRISPSVDFEGSQVYSGLLSNPGGSSDAGEAHVYNFSTDPGDSTAYLTNGFMTANSPSVNTCGQPAVWRHLTSSRLEVGIPSGTGERDWSVPYVLPFTQTFAYWFPSGFGSWEIDNLSAPGGPGGGWAFLYAPCN